MQRLADPSLNRLDIQEQANIIEAISAIVGQETGFRPQVGTASSVTESSGQSVAPRSTTVSRSKTA
eukprot:2464910-Alexandrium_andersonii.AAC.1